MHVLTRGNVDGIAGAALVLADHPEARVSFVTNASVAVQALRRDLSSSRFLAIDLGLTPSLAKALVRKARTGRQTVFLDHHEQTLRYTNLLTADVDRLVVPGISAAAVARRWLQVDGLDHLVAVADVVEYCRSEERDRMEAHVGAARLAEEGRVLDFAWRLKVADDRFRLMAARKLAEGWWPSEIGEVRRRYLQVLNERRWERAVERVRSLVKVRGGIALLSFGARKPSLFGFGTRALAAVAEEQGCRVALLVHRRPDVTSISARVLPHTGTGTGPARREPNLGRFLDTFTQQYGYTGGGHPQAAGGKIPSRHLRTFLDELECFA